MFKSKIKELHVFEGLGRVKTNEVSSGDICALVGIDGFEIGDTVCDFENPEALPPIAIDEPTMSMLFAINDSPFFGKDGKFVTSRHIHDRLMKELDKNLALRVRKSEEDGKWIVSGRVVLHLSVLIETMRREGYELQVGQPQVIFREIDGVKCEPIEELTINVPEEYSSKIIDMVTRRKGEMVKMENTGERINLEFNMPSRGIIGLRTNVLTASAGEAIMAHRFKEYQPHKGEIERRTNGSMIARLRSISSKITLRIRIALGVTSTYSSSLIYSSASSSENWIGGIRRTLSSEPEARIFVNFFDLVTLITRSFS